MEYLKKTHPDDIPLRHPQALPLRQPNFGNGFRDDMDTRSEADAPQGFTRNSNYRASLPVLRRHNNKSREKTMGLVYLQYMGETKRGILPNEITGVDTVRALFVRAFPGKLTLEALEKPERRIYMRDPATEIFYELENLNEVKDHSVLKVHEPGEETHMGTRSAPVSARSTPSDFSLFSEPELDFDNYDKQRQKYQVASSLTTVKEQSGKGSNVNVPGPMIHHGPVPNRGMSDNYAQLSGTLDQNKLKAAQGRSEKQNIIPMQTSQLHQRPSSAMGYREHQSRYTGPDNFRRGTPDRASATLTRNRDYEELHRGPGRQNHTPSHSRNYSDGPQRVPIQHRSVSHEGHVPQGYTPSSVADTNGHHPSPGKGQYARMSNSLDNLDAPESKHRPASQRDVPPTPSNYSQQSTPRSRSSQSLNLPGTPTRNRQRESFGSPRHYSHGGSAQRGRQMNRTELELKQRSHSQPPGKGATDNGGMYIMQRPTSTSITDQAQRAYYMQSPPPNSSGRSTPFDPEANARMSAMEHQIASLAGILETALTTGSIGSPDEQKARKLPPGMSSSRSEEVLRMITGSSVASSEMSADGSDASGSSCVTPVINVHLRNSALDLRQTARTLRDQLKQLRILQLNHAQKMNDMLNITSRKITQALDATPQANNHPIRAERSRVHQEFIRYKSTADKIHYDLEDLEATVEETRCDVVNKQCRVDMQDISNMSTLLGNTTKKISEQKVAFPILSDKMKKVMNEEMSVVVQEENFLKEEPPKLDDYMKRCKKLTGTLHTLKRLGGVQEHRSPVVPVIEPSPGVPSRSALLENIKGLEPDHDNRVKKIQAADESRERKRRFTNSQDLRKFEKSLDQGNKSLRKTNHMNDIESRAKSHLSNLYRQEEHDHMTPIVTPEKREKLAAKKEIKLNKQGKAPPPPPPRRSNLSARVLQSPENSSAGSLSSSEGTTVVTTSTEKVDDPSFVSKKKVVLITKTQTTTVSPVSKEAEVNVNTKNGTGIDMPPQGVSVRGNQCEDSPLALKIPTELVVRPKVKTLPIVAQSQVSPPPAHPPPPTQMDYIPRPAFLKKSVHDKHSIQKQSPQNVQKYGLVSPRAQQTTRLPQPQVHYNYGSPNMVSHQRSPPKIGPKPNQHPMQLVPPPKPPRAQSTKITAQPLNMPKNRIPTKQYNGGHTQHSNMQSMQSPKRHATNHSENDYMNIDELLKLRNGGSHSYPNTPRKMNGSHPSPRMVNPQASSSTVNIRHNDGKQYGQSSNQAHLPKSAFSEVHGPRSGSPMTNGNHQQMQRNTASPSPQHRNGNSPNERTRLAKQLSNPKLNMSPSPVGGMKVGCHSLSNSPVQHQKDQQLREQYAILKKLQQENKRKQNGSPSSQPQVAQPNEARRQQQTESLDEVLADLDRVVNEPLGDGKPPSTPISTSNTAALLNGLVPAPPPMYGSMLDKQKCRSQTLPARVSSPKVRKSDLQSLKQLSTGTLKVRSNTLGEAPSDSVWSVRNGNLGTLRRSQTEGNSIWCKAEDVPKSARGGLQGMETSI
ncbi:SRC kinase signaling inhibitor 1-like [Anneissia japonica]|uniref:SRC kinase signaling inhibitor 1-like n=1 Tax=Anneissia japonica TaxID=1529436 RepID=UPI0014257ECD|nr:SRC kinase signaling inhibitor 1-like [Anneissia japonica]